MDASIDQIYGEALAEIEAASTADQLNTLQIKYLGRKGILTQVLRSLTNLKAEERAAVGKKANQAKTAIQSAIQGAVQRIESRAGAPETSIDVTLPGRRPSYGSVHPITQITDQICDIFSGLGFDIVEGPEVESDYYNFEALNIPKNHPARDMQDTFYVSENIVLRTHTSPVQIRTM